MTPWGESRELTARRLRPGPGASRAEVEANQRERMFGAMVAAVAGHGYGATRVADVVELSGVSRNTFYKHFRNKLDCFLATMDATLACGGPGVTSAYLDHEGTWEERLAAGFDELIATIVAQPAAARLFYVESHAAGPHAVAKVDAFGGRIEEITRSILGESQAHAGLPDELLRAIFRGIRRIVQSRLRAGREAELLAIGPQLLRWALGYEMPPRSLEHPTEPPPHRFEVRQPDPEDPRERIMSAVIELMVANGYRKLTITDIAQHAAVSLTTFYRHFHGKDEAVVAALRRSTGQVVEAVSPAFQDAPDWPRAVAAGLRAFFAFLVLPQPFARFGGVNVVYSGSRFVLDVREQLLSAAQAFIAEGYHPHHGVEPIAGEAIGASIDALAFEQIVVRGERRLYEITPTATYIALVPFVGVEEACAIANASR